MLKPLPCIKPAIYRKLTDSITVMMCSSDSNNSLQNPKNVPHKSSSKNEKKETSKFTLNMADLKEKLKALNTSIANDTQIKGRLKIAPNKMTNATVLKAAERLGIEKLVSQKPIAAQISAEKDENQPEIDPVSIAAKSAPMKPRPRIQKEKDENQPEIDPASIAAKSAPMKPRSRAQKKSVSKIAEPADVGPLDGSLSDFVKLTGFQAQAAMERDMSLDWNPDKLSDSSYSRKEMKPRRSQNEWKSGEMNWQDSSNSKDWSDNRQPRREMKPENSLKVGWLPKLTKEGIFTAAKPIGIFNPSKWADRPPAETVPLTKQWQKHFETKYDQGIPSNPFEEMITWTKKGQMWQYPIDNEQGMDTGETFDEHVFLERHLADFPEDEAIRQFMSLVCIGLSNNPYISAREKRDHIEWFREYFEENQTLLNAGL